MKKCVLICLVCAGIGCDSKKPVESEGEKSKVEATLERETTAPEPPERRQLPPSNDWMEARMVPDENRRQVAIANEAQRQLGMQLIGRLTAAIAEGGAAAGVEVCSKEAPEIAAKVGEANEVRIGRTSHKLRNPENAAPTWMSSVVEEKSSERRYFTGPEGALGVASPIPMAELCLQCHGPEAKIAADVKAAVAANYPKDMATGFEMGDVRGWFWVEVPVFKMPSD